MTDRPPKNSRGPGPYNDPFSDDPSPGYADSNLSLASRPPMPQPYDPGASAQNLGSRDPYDEDEFAEKQPLTGGDTYNAGGFYPPPPM